MSNFRPVDRDTGFLLPPGQSGEAYKVFSQDRRRAVDYVRPSICTLVEE